MEFAWVLKVNPSPASQTVSEHKQYDMKNNFLFLISIVLIISCDKEEEPSFINIPSDEIIRYQITVENNQIAEYVKYVNDIQLESTVFQDFDSVVYMIRTNASNEIIYKKTYHIANSDLASSAIDSSFSEYGLYVANLEYEYNNGFLINTNIDWKREGENADSGQVYIGKTIENENIVEINESFPDWPSGCTDYLKYNNLINKLDIRNLTNGITGKISKNLVQHATWNSGCPCGPSSSVAYSDFNYELDENGYVVKMSEIYTPCYHLSTAEEVTRTIKTTIYEYNVR